MLVPLFAALIAVGLVVEVVVVLWLKDIMAAQHEVGGGLVVVLLLGDMMAVLVVVGLELGLELG